MPNDVSPRRDAFRTDAYRPVAFRVNGKDASVTVDPRASLLDTLRDGLGLTGTKKGCDHGQCGACTVMVNGRRINSCLTLAVMHDGDEITTVEGIGAPDAPAPLQSEFMRCDGFQCGYCTPGQIVSATAMLEEARAGWPSHVSESLDGPTALTDAEIAERMSGNLCRCSAYAGIREAIARAADTDRKEAAE